MGATHFFFEYLHKFSYFKQILSCKLFFNICNIGYIVYSAQNAYMEVARLMKKRREHNNFERLKSVYDTHETDPAENDPMLAANLKENRKFYAQKMNDFLKKYAN